MIARAFSQTTQAARAVRAGGQQVRCASGLPIPPKIATPQSVAGGESGSNTDSVVGFYKALPKASEPEMRSSGIKERYFNGKNASGKPIVATIGLLMLVGYTLEYNGHLRPAILCLSH
ncbi:ATP synthase f chain, mitochondrial precursor [Malassezia sp. CBS 17886]|nr:ATP synthase f chain, mitochondrial precursor [Malassezia sp. CBS 17886]